MQRRAEKLKKYAPICTLSAYRRPVEIKKGLEKFSNPLNLLATPGAEPVHFEIVAFYPVTCFKRQQLFQQGEIAGFKFHHLAA